MASMRPRMPTTPSRPRALDRSRSRRLGEPSGFEDRPFDSERCEAWSRGMDSDIEFLDPRGRSMRPSCIRVVGGGPVSLLPRDSLHAPYLAPSLAGLPGGELTLSLGQEVDLDPAGPDSAHRALMMASLPTRAPTAHEVLVRLIELASRGAGGGRMRTDDRDAAPPRGRRRLAPSFAPSSPPSASSAEVEQALRAAQGDERATPLARLALELARSSDRQRGVVAEVRTLVLFTILNLRAARECSEVLLRRGTHAGSLEVAAVSELLEAYDDIALTLDRAMELMRQLGVGRTQAPPADEPTSLSRAVHAARRMAERGASPPRVCIQSLPAVMVRSPSGELVHVLLNLLRNGGEGPGGDEVDIDISGWEEDGAVFLRIAHDQDDPIDGDTSAPFHPDEQTRRAELRRCRKLVQRWGGRLDVDADASIVLEIPRWPVDR